MSSRVVSNASAIYYLNNSKHFIIYYISRRSRFAERSSFGDSIDFIPPFFKIPLFQTMNPNMILVGFIWTQTC